MLVHVSGLSEIGIDWPIHGLSLVLSDKDRVAPLLEDADGSLLLIDTGAGIITADEAPRVLKLSEQDFR